MQDEDLTDLAMIAACFQRLVCRASDLNGNARGMTIAKNASAALTTISGLYGATAEQVHTRLDEIRDSMRSPRAGAVH